MSSMTRARRMTGSTTSQITTAAARPASMPARTPRRSTEPKLRPTSVAGDAESVTRVVRQLVEHLRSRCAEQRTVLLRDQVESEDREREQGPGPSWDADGGGGRDGGSRCNCGHGELTLSFHASWTDHRRSRSPGFQIVTPPQPSQRPAVTSGEWWGLAPWSQWRGPRRNHTDFPCTAALAS